MRIASKGVQGVASQFQCLSKVCSWSVQLRKNRVDGIDSLLRRRVNFRFVYTRCCIVSHCCYSFLSSSNGVPQESEASRLSPSIFKKATGMSTFGLSPRLSRHSVSMRGGGRLWQSLKARAAIRRRSSFPRLCGRTVPSSAGTASNSLRIRQNGADRTST